MAAQRYTGLQSALDRMESGLCPECGKPAGEHNGGGLGTGSPCTLTDYGVTIRIAQYREDRGEEGR